jgi:hypothetical protein
MGNWAKDKFAYGRLRLSHTTKGYAVITKDRGKEVVTGIISAGATIYLQQRFSIATTALLSVFIPITVFFIAGFIYRFLFTAPREIWLDQQRTIVDLERENAELRSREEALKQPGFDMNGGEVYDYMKVNSGFETVREFETALSVKAYEKDITVYAMAMDSTRWLQVDHEVFRNHIFRLAPKKAVTLEEDPWGTLAKLQKMGGDICLESDYKKISYQSPQFLRAQIEFYWPRKARN